MRIVLESSLDTKKVIRTPSTMTQVNSKVEARDCKGEDTLPTKNMVIIAMRVGNTGPWLWKHFC